MFQDWDVMHEGGGHPIDALMPKISAATVAGNFISTDSGKESDTLG